MAPSKRHSSLPSGAATRQSKKHPVQQKSFGNSTVRTHYLWYLLIIGFTFALYGNTLNHNFTLDDDIFGQKNAYVQQGLKGIGKILTTSLYHGFNQTNEGAYRPLVLINMAIEKHFFGGTAGTGHFFNVFFYALCGVLLFRFLNQLFISHPARIYLTLAVTVLYLAHPVHTEVVANIKSRDEILSFLFSILTFHYLLLYTRKPGFIPLTVSLFCYFFALLSKEYGLTFIAVIPLFLWFFAPHIPLKKIFLFTVPFIGVAILYFLIRSSILTDIAFKEKMEIINNSLAGATNPSERLATAIAILGYYLKLLIWPHPLSFDYSYNQFPLTGWLHPKTIIALCAYGFLGLFAIWRLKKRDPVSFGILFFFITLSIVSNIFIEIGSTLGERFLFTPSLGFCLAFSVTLWEIASRLQAASLKNTPIFLVVVLAGLMLGSVKTVSRNRDWKNNITLFSADVKACPNSARTHFSLAYELAETAKRTAQAGEKQKLFSQAEEEYRKCLDIYPGFWSAWYNLGVAYYEFGMHDKALQAYNMAIEKKPDYAEALNNAGVIYFNRNIFDTALTCFRRASRYNPSFADAYANMGAVYHNRGIYDSALVWYNMALRFDPGNKNVKANMEKLPQNRKGP